MEKLPIKIVLIGHVDRVIDQKYLRDFDSKYFVINQFERIERAPNPQETSGYLNIVYTKQEITDLLAKVSCSGICIGIMSYPFNDNFYMHQLESNQMCISLSGIDSTLMQKDISIENFIIKCIYETFLFYKIFGTLSDDRIHDFVHLDTRGCVFDLNGDKGDVIFNTEKPIICDECKARIKQYSIPIDFLNSISKELKRIRKPKIKSIELLIRKYPLISLVLTFLFSTMINLFSNFLWNLLISDR